MSIAWTAAKEIALYDKYVNWILGSEEDWEDFVYEALVLRSSLHTRWPELTTAEKENVRRADNHLVAAWRKVAGFLPPHHAPPRSEWWWFLHEGPQVREQAAQAA
jgi:hypothetical protein